MVLLKYRLNQAYVGADPPAVAGRLERRGAVADAPQQDPEGNKTMVRFSRKTKQQYVAAEKEGKATGWSAFFVDGKWAEGKK